MAGVFVSVRTHGDTPETARYTSPSSSWATCGGAVELVCHSAVRSTVAAAGARSGANAVRAICTASAWGNRGKPRLTSRHNTVAKRHLMRRSRSRLRARASRDARASRRMTSCRSEYRWATPLRIKCTHLSVRHWGCGNDSIRGNAGMLGAGISGVAAGRNLQVLEYCGSGIIL